MKAFIVLSLAAFAFAVPGKDPILRPRNPSLLLTPHQSTAPLQMDPAVLPKEVSQAANAPNPKGPTPRISSDDNH
jgi:hypothetical protein